MQLGALQDCNVQMLQVGDFIDPRQLCHMCQLSLVQVCCCYVLLFQHFLLCIEQSAMLFAFQRHIWHAWQHHCIRQQLWNLLPCRPRALNITLLMSIMGRTRIRSSFCHLVYAVKTNYVSMQELSALMSEHDLTGLAEQLQAAGVSVPTNSLASARSTNSVGSSRSGSLSSMGSSRRVAAQRSMRLSTGSIG